MRKIEYTRKPVTVRFPDETLERLNKRIGEDGIRNSYIVKSVEEKLEREKKLKRKRFT